MLIYITLFTTRTLPADILAQYAVGWVADTDCCDAPGVANSLYDLIRQDIECSEKYHPKGKNAKALPFVWHFPEHSISLSTPNGTMS